MNVHSSKACDGSEVMKDDVRDDDDAGTDGVGKDSGDEVSSSALTRGVCDSDPAIEGQCRVFDREMVLEDKKRAISESSLRFERDK